MKSLPTFQHHNGKLTLDIEIVAKTDRQTINNLNVKKELSAGFDTTVNTLKPTLTSTLNSLSFTAKM